MEKILRGTDMRNTFCFMSAKKNDPTFEEALQNLETLVTAMESGDVPLAQLVEKFEEGSRLVKICEERLQQAELKIETLRKEQESLVLEAFDPEKE
jgi:exodeoxyribonuclease VII small subunit